MGWPTLGHWLAEDPEDADFIACLKTAAEQWEASEYPPGLLWRGQAARSAEYWAKRYKKPLARREQHYLDAVFQNARWEQSRRQSRFLGLALAGTFAVTIGMSTLGGWALEERDRARQAQAWAEYAVEEERTAKKEAEMAAQRERQARERLAQVESQRNSRRIAAESSKAIEDRKRAEKAKKDAARAIQQAKMEVQKARQAQKEADARCGGPPSAASKDSEQAL